MISRRGFLQGALVAGAALATPTVWANTLSAGSERRLRFYNIHTGEHLTATYWSGKGYVTDELAAIDHLLRDFRTGQARHIDTALLDRLYKLQQTLGRHDAFHVISGYRSPATNSALRSHSGGVAKHSLHMQGRAIDIRLPGVELSNLRHAALAQKAGGVGYYPKSNFVHIDTGRPRFW